MKLVKSIILTLFLALPVIGFSAESININTADKEMLMMIKGIGEKKAEAIITYRNKNGNFKSVEELVNIRGISQTMIDKHREQLSISD